MDTTFRANDQVKKILRWYVLAAVSLISTTAAAGDPPKVDMEATASFWWHVYEEVENGLIQTGSQNEAADVSSEFNFRHGRLGFRLESHDAAVSALIRLRLEERTDVIDFWGAYHAASWLNIFIGQMKIPSTFEVLLPYYELDFATRTSFGKHVGDYSLSRTPYISSIMAAKSYYRDLGVSLKGSFPGREKTFFSYFCMVGNGIGANKYIGGGERSGFVYTNRFGDFYYGLRLEATPVSWITIGTHYSKNTHDDIALGDRGPVFDIDRTVWTADFRTHLPWKLRVDGFYGAGEMDDYFDAQRYRFDYNGWGLWMMKACYDDKIELGLRYDSFTTEFNNDGNKTSQQNWTIGVNLRPQNNLRLQLDYINKETVNDFESDFGDDIVLVNFQFLFDRRLVQ